MASLFKEFCWLFYIVDRNTTTFKSIEEVPRYSTQIVHIFFTLILSEIIIKYIKYNKSKVRLYDGITSVTAGFSMDVVKLATNGVEFIGYQWLYEYRYLDLDWESPLTWWAALIGVDFGYYWLHRAAHEINLVWGGHLAHHTSEDYNFTTALRLSPFQHILGIGFYHPLALLGVPLSAVLLHLEFNLIFQFWLHTELIPKLGPLEWIFNTASHHRVHHGINKWCLDKNYAGFLIIWDRMFGTFQEERDDEKIVYGIVTQPQTFNPIYIQVYYFKSVLQKAWSMESWSDTFKAIFYGPGWAPGTPRLGDENAIPDKTPEREKYNPSLSLWVDCYVVLHFLVTVLIYQKFMQTYSTFNWFTALVFIFVLFFTFISFGSIFDGRSWAPLFETARCIATVALLRSGCITITGNLIIDSAISGYFVISTLIWSTHSLSLLMSPKLKN